MKRHRADSTQKEIVDVFRRLGATVETITQSGRSGCPDLIVGYRGQNHLVEVKSKGGKLRETQKWWKALWRGEEPYVCYSVEEAIALVETWSGGLRKLVK